MHLKNSGVGVQDLRLVGELRHFGGELEQRVGDRHQYHEQYHEDGDHA